MNNLIVVLIIVVALLYVLFPRDLLPDFLLGWGWIDDLAVLYVLWRYYRRVRQVQRTADRFGQPRDESNGERAGNADGEQQSAQDPYAVLGIAPGASREEIKAAYRRQIAKYHPDKVQHLGKEFQQLAEKRFKEIQQAYEQLISA